MDLPKSYEENMRKLLKEEFEEYKKCLDEPMHHGIRINTLKISVEEFLKINPFHLKKVPWCENGFYYDETVDKPSRHPYYYAGLYYIQEPSAMTPASVLPVNDGDRVLDLCAAPGGKSTELAAKLNGTGILVSNDISASRAKALLKNLEVFGVVNSLIISEAPYRLGKRFHEYFDKILIDAPCSGEGMFRKSQSMITAWENNQNQVFVDIQRDILKYVVDMLKPGGTIVYSTCTFSPLENEQSVEYMLSLDERLSLCEFDKYGLFGDGHPEWSLSGNDALKKCARIWPHKVEGEGHFVCLARKDGTCDSRGNFGSYRRKKAKLSAEALAFFERLGNKIDVAGIEMSDDKLYYITDSFPDVKGLRILRCGLFLGENKKNRFEPSQSLAMTLTKGDFDNEIDLSHEDIRVIKYLKGETIEAGGVDGWTLVLVDGYPLGWGKLNKGILKNKYLPGWRLL
ncbi:MAG: RsmB/NOP family class I SAM-dependent RNA methyltransferase [Clostridium sp.]|nr:RsmB/NOP family class I SAM-dependent RNA methyltransferase [Clostridium sp.]MCM1398794.1 RsmB/NOP family class I SAM-dependent RNA methyltransferase [Clostridium sp.]MCM1458574.1 RsmB/NOP family class I SAM-dependent RNA methyltransferase [Bacteroides sp.]